MTASGLAGLVGVSISLGYVGGAAFVYLFAIGLEPIFSFRWNLPPTSHSNPEERDSLKACSKPLILGIGASNVLPR